MLPSGGCIHYFFAICKISSVSSMQTSSIFIASFPILRTQDLTGLQWDSLFTYLRKPYFKLNPDGGKVLLPLKKGK